MDTESIKQLTSDINRVVDTATKPLFAKILQLQIEKEVAEAAYKSCFNGGQAKELEKQDKRIKLLEAAWKKYGWHKKDCMLFSIAEHPKCSCGFEQALHEELEQ